MAAVIKRDDSVLTSKEQIVLSRTLETLNQFFPEHKVYAFDSLCSQQRENSAKLAKRLGYPSIDDFLLAYGYELIKGSEVYEIRKNCGIKPGEEPVFIKERLNNSISSLDEYYPSHVIDGAIQRDHKKLAQTLSGLWQWLGYRSMEDMLAAYGFTYNAKAGRSKSVDSEAIVAELIKRYPEGTTMSAGEIAKANPDLKIKSVMNQSNDIFDMSFAKYLKEMGVIVSNKANSEEEIETNNKVAAVKCLKEFNNLFQRESLGWKVLPKNSAVLINELDDSASKRELKKAMKILEVDPEAHFRGLHVIAREDTDNEFRALIKHIDIKAVIGAAGLTVAAAKRQPESASTIMAENTNSPEMGENTPNTEVFSDLQDNNDTLPTDAGANHRFAEADAQLLETIIIQLKERYVGKAKPVSFKELKSANNDIGGINLLRPLVSTVLNKSADEYLRELGLISHPNSAEKLSVNNDLPYKKANKRTVTTNDSADHSAFSVQNGSVEDLKTLRETLGIFKDAKAPEEQSSSRTV